VLIIICILCYSFHNRFTFAADISIYLNISNLLKMSIDIEAQMKDIQLRMSRMEAGTKDQLSMVVFSGDLDKILAAMIIATGAAAYDMKVKLFFTFWATAALRDPKKSGKGKSLIEKMFGMMLPKGTGKLKLSRMHMCGMGTKMIRGIMKKHKVPTLEEMFKTAGELGVEILICDMSMNLMGFQKEEMIDYPSMTVCGVATFLSDAQESKIQLFI
jgi:peroxiredoxin family protein